MHLQQFVLHKGHMLSSCHGRFPFFLLFSVFGCSHSQQIICFHSFQSSASLSASPSVTPTTCVSSLIHKPHCLCLFPTHPAPPAFPTFLRQCTQYLPSESVQTNLISPLVLCPWTIQTKLSLWCTHFLKSCPSLSLQMQISALLIHPPLATPHM